MGHTASVIAGALLEGLGGLALIWLPWPIGRAYLDIDPSSKMRQWNVLNARGGAVFLGIAMVWGAATTAWSLWPR
jgi:hypothetical protein